MGVSGPFAAALLEAVAVGVHLQDVNVVGDAVEQRAGEPFGAEDLSPLVERQICAALYKFDRQPQMGVFGCRYGSFSPANSIGRGTAAPYLPCCNGDGTAPDLTPDCPLFTSTPITQPTPVQVMVLCGVPEQRLPTGQR